MECEVAEAGELAGADYVDPGGEGGAEAIGEYLAEVANVSGGSVQFRSACQDLLQAGPVFVGQGRGVPGEPAGHLSHRRRPRRCDGRSPAGCGDVRADYAVGRELVR